MFGNHLPKLDTDFYEKLFNKNIDELDSEEVIKLYTTPFIIWANYDIGYKYIDKMSANYLLVYIMEMFGFEKDEYRSFLRNQLEHLPVISGKGFIDKNQNFFHQDNLPNEYVKWLESYNILQYENMYE